MLLTTRANFGFHHLTVKPRRPGSGGAVLRYVGTIALAGLLALMVSAGPAAAAPGIVTDEYPVPTPGMNPFMVTAGPDGNLWFTEGGDPVGVTGKIGRITPSGTVTEFPTATSLSYPIGITAGPDGNLWFTEYNSNGKIGKITPDGVITEYQLPTRTSDPIGITAGPDGNLWFTEDSQYSEFGDYGNKIGKITLAGVITEYTIPTAASDPYFITAGPDGNLWFTERVGNKIGKITLAGVFTEYSVPTAASDPYFITAGPDGNLWFTESSGNKIGKITPAGVITEYPIPTAASDPRGIVAGANGTLWFTERSGNKIGSITTTGTITEYSVPTASSGLTGITAGPNGTLWFAERSGNKIGKFTLPTPAISSSTVVVASPSGAVVEGAAVTLTGQVSPVSAVGTIAIFDGTTSLGSGAANNGAFTVSTSTLALGRHSLTARFTPANAQDYQASTSAAVAFSVNAVDVTAPVVAITGGADAPTNETTPTITGTTDASTGTTVTVTVAGQTLTTTVQTGGTWSVTPTALAAGTHTVVASITDPAGNTGTATQTLTVNARAAADPPASSTGELQNLVETQGLDVSGTTDSFVPSGDTTDNPLDSLDASKTFSGTLPWVNTQDSFVDVYAYSSPVFLGTFPVVNGKVQITGVDLSALQAGGHHLVFVGQTSGTVSVMAVTVAAAGSVSLLSSTGVDPAVPIGAAGILLLLGLGLLIVAARRRRRA